MSGKYPCLGFFMSWEAKVAPYLRRRGAIFPFFFFFAWDVELVGKGPGVICLNILVVGERQGRGFGRTLRVGINPAKEIERMAGVAKIGVTWVCVGGHVHVGLGGRGHMLKLNSRRF